MGSGATQPAPPPRVAALLDDIAQRHPRSRRGLQEARAVDPTRWDARTDATLSWIEGARGPEGLAACVDAYVGFCGAVNLAQARYEADGAYPRRSHAEVAQALYTTHAMHDYLWGVLLTNVLWSHHFELLEAFAHEFVPRLPAGARLLELACGHGGWGVTALTERDDLTLTGYDLSEVGIGIARAVSKAAGVAQRAGYEVADALALPPGEPVPAVVCCFLLEHLDEPAALLAAIAQRLQPRGVAWVTGALTAAQDDHIFEFRRESELVALAEDAGLRVLSTRSVAPQRTLPRARFLPRSMAMIVQRRKGELW